MTVSMTPIDLIKKVVYVFAGPFSLSRRHGGSRNKSKFDITRDRNQSLSQLRIDNSVVAIAPGS